MIKTVARRMLFTCRLVPAASALLALAVHVALYRANPCEGPLNAGLAPSTSGLAAANYFVSRTHGSKTEHLREVWKTDLKIDRGASSAALWFEMSEASRSSGDEHGASEAHFSIDETRTNLEKIEPHAQCASLAAVANLMINEKVEEWRPRALYRTNDLYINITAMNPFDPVFPPPARHLFQVQRFVQRASEFSTHMRVRLRNQERRGGDVQTIMRPT